MNALPERRVLCWDKYLEPNEGDMEFRLTYAGELKAHRDDKRLAGRSLHVHEIRKHFHKQLAVHWREHPSLAETLDSWTRRGVLDNRLFKHDGFEWFPLVTEDNGLICKLDVLLLRAGSPGRVLHDVDNRLKTLFDALRKAKGPQELGQSTDADLQTPGPDEAPFYVLLEDDRLITHVAVTTDTLLEPVPNVPPGEAVRLVVDVTVRPYKVSLDNLDFI